jgi:hypothetical protein
MGVTGAVSLCVKKRRSSSEPFDADKPLGPM